MGTLTLTTMRSLIRSDLNESSTTILSNTELNSLINDGYKDTAVKALCYENKIAFNNIATTQKIVPLVFATNHIIRVNYVEYKSGATEGGLGMLGVLPQTVGRITIDTYVPQFWFQWGDYLVIEPLPDAATYDLEVYAACYPAAVLSADGDLPSSIPAEFHECVYTFALAFAALKLRRWGDAAIAYNRYIGDIQMKRAQYVMKYPEGRLVHEIPGNVTMEAPNRGR